MCRPDGGLVATRRLFSCQRCAGSWGGAPGKARQSQHSRARVGRAPAGFLTAKGHQRDSRRQSHERHLDVEGLGDDLMLLAVLDLAGDLSLG